MAGLNDEPGDEFEDEGLPDLPVTDPAQLPPDEGDAGATDDLADDTGAPPDPAALALTPQQRAAAQNLVLRGARLMLARPAAVHYTQGPRRWQGIADRLLVRDGRFPSYSDCSSAATWLLWNALHIHLGMADVVNGQRWAAGYTGTMLRHGRAVSASSAQVGDLVIYGSGAPGKHVTVCLGGGMVFSHGSEAGPFKLALRYRSDVLSVRRYF